MKRLCILLIIFSFGCNAQDSTDATRYKKFMKDREELLLLFRATPRLTEIDKPDIIQFVDKSKGQVFLVTKEGHPAHPAIVSRQVIEVNGQLAIKMNGDGGGSKEALKIWIDYMASEDNKIVEQKKNRSKWQVKIERVLTSNSLLPLG